MNDLFAELMAVSELSPLFAENALRRALQRAGVAAERLSPADILTAYPQIDRTVRTFLPERADAIMERVRRLSRGAP